MKRKRTSFSKLLLLLESAIVLYTTYQGFGIAKLAIELDRRSPAGEGSGAVSG